MRNCQAQIFILDAFVSIFLSICLSVCLCLSVRLSVCWLNWQKPPRVIDAFFLPFRTIKTYENHAFIVQEVPQIHAQPLLPGVADVATASSLISACVFRCASLWLKTTNLPADRSTTGCLFSGIVFVRVENSSHSRLQKTPHRPRKYAHFCGK